MGHPAKTFVLACSLAAITGQASPAEAQKFRPFTSVTSACPSCNLGRHYDRIVLTDGTEVQAAVVAENDMFYLLEKFGELRAVGRGEVRSIERGKDVERAKGYDDQVLFKDDLVISGTLSETAERTASGDDRYELRTPQRFVHNVYKSMVAAMFRHGKTIYVAEKPK